MTFKTEQEAFWAGEFGNEYIQRNQGDALVAANLGLFAKALSMTRGVQSCIEFGANIGLNLKALKLLFPAQEQYAVEINANAASELTRVIPPSNLYRTSILDFNSEQTWDLVLIKGVLIHINPEMLPQVDDKLEAACSRYLLVVEYYNPVPVAVAYRGDTDRLFKRDFAGEIMDRHSRYAVS
jgi:pseudaminic acid biosynthesis-associated methylase